MRLNRSALRFDCFEGFRVCFGTTKPVFDYDVAFGRNLGVVTREEQQKLRRSRVVLAGLGGVGGIYAEALARLGVGSFTLADGDTFEVANFNRQMGGTLSAVGENKARTLERRIHEINPEAEVRVREEHLHKGNIDAFLKDADLVVDGIEAFSIPAHRLLLRRARAHGLSVFVAAPLGFSVAAVVFGPKGMTADEYFDWRDGQDSVEQVINLVLGLAPRLLHAGNFDPRYVDFEGHTGPSHIGACLLCAGLLACEATRLLLGRSGTRSAPAYVQFDPYSGRLRRGRLRWGNRGPLQRLKKRLLLRLSTKIQAMRTTERPAESKRQS